MPYFIEEGRTGLLLHDDDPEELASLMQQALESDDLSANVASRHDRYVHEYSWDAVAERIAKVID